MNKKFVFILLVFVLIVLLIACGDQSSFVDKNDSVATPTEINNDSNETEAQVAINGNDKKWGTPIPFELVTNNSDATQTIVYFLIDNSASVYDYCGSEYIDKSYFSEIPRTILNIFQNIASI